MFDFNSCLHFEILEFNLTRLLGTVTKVFQMPQNTFGFLLKTFDDLYY